MSAGLWTCGKCGHSAPLAHWPVKLGHLRCAVCFTPEFHEDREQQLIVLSAEGDECAAADLFKEQ